MEVKKNILVFLFFAWIILAVISVFININKTYFEINEWGALTDTQKRVKIFGDLFLYSSFIGAETNGEDILLISDNDMSFFLSRYYLYPQRIYWNREEKIPINQNIEYQTVVTYNKSLDLDNFEQVATFSAESGNYGYIYYKK